MAEVVIPSTYYLPNSISRSLLLSLEEIIGHTGLTAVLNSADLRHLVNNLPPSNLDPEFPFDDVGRLYQGLENLYGPRGGRGLGQRGGRAFFRYSLREFGPRLGLTDLTFRLLPMPMKLKASVEGFASVFNQYADEVVELEEQPDAFCWHLRRCPFCWGRHTQGACCHTAVGLLQETLYWISGGKNFLVEETCCLARGDASCQIRIDRQPLD
jgi:predicted hydrocarbon binding protein